MDEFFGFTGGVSGGPRADQTGVQFTPTWPAHELTTRPVMPVDSLTPAGGVLRCDARRSVLRAEAGGAAPRAIPPR